MNLGERTVLRVRATRNGRFFEDIPSALTEEIQEDGKKAEIILEKEGKAARITNGKLVACFQRQEN